MRNSDTERIWLFMKFHDIKNLGVIKHVRYGVAIHRLVNSVFNSCLAFEKESTGKR